MGSGLDLGIPIQGELQNQFIEVEKPEKDPLSDDIVGNGMTRQIGAGKLEVYPPDKKDAVLRQLDEKKKASKKMKGGARYEGSWGAGRSGAGRSGAGRSGAGRSGAGSHSESSSDEEGEADFEGGMLKSLLPASSFSGMGKKSKSKAKPKKEVKEEVKKPNKRAEIVKKVMKDKGLSMIEASKYVKEHKLY
jgi:hypothetical protein